MVLDPKEGRESFTSRIGRSTAAKVTLAAAMLGAQAGEVDGDVAKPDLTAILKTEPVEKEIPRLLKKIKTRSVEKPREESKTTKKDIALLTEALGHPPVAGSRATSDEVLALIEIFHAPIYHLRVAAIHVLEDEGKRITKLLERALDDRDPEVGFDAQAVLNHFRSKDDARADTLMEPVSRLADIAKNDKAAHALLISEALPVIRALLKEYRKPDLQKEIIRFLENTVPESKAAIPELEAILKNPETEREVKQHIINKALVPMLPETGAIHALYIAASDQDENVSTSAVDALAKPPPSDETVKLLSKLLDNESTDVRASAAKALAGQGDLARPLVPKLLAMLDKNNCEKREKVAVLKTLGSIGHSNPEVMSKLIVSFKDQENDVRVTAIEAVGSHPQPESKVAMKVLTALLKDEEPPVMLAAVDALIGMGDALKGIAPDAIAACAALKELGNTQISETGYVHGKKREAIQKAKAFTASLPGPSR